MTNMTTAQATPQPRTPYLNTNTTRCHRRSVRGWMKCAVAFITDDPIRGSQRNTPNEPRAMRERVFEDARVADVSDCRRWQGRHPHGHVKREFRSAASRTS